MPADVFPIGGALKGWPGAVGIEAWWYDQAPPQPWVRTAMPEPTVPWDQARCMILWASDRAPSGGQLRGNILNPGGGIIEIGQGHPTLRAEVEAFEGSTVASPVRILMHYLNE
jgi:hypothetical protein